LKRLEENLERIGRDVKIGRQGEQRFSVQPRERDGIDNIGSRINRRLDERL
jgi:superfamily II DNA/RNA helicase